jgi:hypothetical protein
MSLTPFECKKSLLLERKKGIMAVDFPGDARWRLAGAQDRSLGGPAVGWT